MPTCSITGVTGLGAANLLEAISLTCPQTRFYQASSSDFMLFPMQIALLRSR
jgi:GDP-D-mannose dehydratase